MNNSIPSHWQIPMRGRANPAAVVSAPQVRFTVLTSRLIRLEYSPTDQFEDRPSQPFWFREQPVPHFTVQPSDKQIIIITDHLYLTYKLSSAGFTAENLTIKALTEPSFVWRYGQQDGKNLLGTYRTLDGVSGSTPLEPGLLSRSGWVVVDDTHRLVFNEQGWLEPRPDNPGYLDLYFFGYGHAYQTALEDFHRLSGPVPMLPRFALGNWWSRYWEYSAEELQELMGQFEMRHVPLSVCIVDMDWHIINNPTHRGWTGYTWNKELFPDPAGFIAWLHDKGLKTALNLHPADGVAPHEDHYVEMAKKMGLNPAEQKPIPFAISDPNFAQAYFSELHHPLEKEGVDFWWMDWQQGEKSGLHGLDPLWWLNHLHFYDLGRDGQKRPFIFSRWGGLGNHRYPIGFSGDTYVNWDSLQFQPYFTATAANVGYGWWSHDLGGHMGGQEDPELYARWVQYGVFSPIFRLHSTKNQFHERCPWEYDGEPGRVSEEALRLRQAIIPYLYTMNWLNHTQHLAPIRPMYHLYPTRDEAYVCPQQYTFGTELIAAPYTTPADPDTRLSRQLVWLPAGLWFDFFTGRMYPGDQWHTLYGNLGHIPLFAKTGAIVPLALDQEWSDTSNPHDMVLHLFAGASHSFTLYEDDGETAAYQQGSYAQTSYETDWQENMWRITLHPPQGEAKVTPAVRTYHLCLHGVIRPSSVNVVLNGVPQDCHFGYEAEKGLVSIEPITVTRTGTVVITVLTNTAATLLRPLVDDTAAQFKRLLNYFRMDTNLKQGLWNEREAILAKPQKLAEYELALTNSQLQALYELLLGVGLHWVSYRPGEGDLVLWNNKGVSCIYAYSHRDAGGWGVHQFTNETGSLPAFKVVHQPASKRKRLDLRQLSWEAKLDFGQGAFLKVKSAG